MTTHTYALIEIDEPTETLLLVEVLAEEPLKPVLVDALEDQHGGELKDVEFKNTGVIEVLWRDNCGETFVYHAVKIERQRVYQSWAVKHGRAAA